MSSILPTLALADSHDGTLSRKLTVCAGFFFLGFKFMLGGCLLPCLV